MRGLLFVIVALAAAACATPNTGVTTLEGDLLSVTRTGASSFSDQDELRREAMSEARAHCAAQNQQFELVELVEARPPYILGHYPKAEVRFRCRA